MSQSNPDFRPLGMAIMKLALFFIAGALMTYTYNRIMVNVSQGTMKKIRIDVFTHMESLPIKYFDTHAHGDIMSIYTNDIDTLRQMISQSIPRACKLSCYYSKCVNKYDYFKYPTYNTYSYNGSYNGTYNW